MSNRNFVYLIVLLFIFSCRPSLIENYDKEPDEVIISLNQKKPGVPRKIKLKVVSEKIIQVMGTPGDKFPADSSLMVIDNLQKNVLWDLAENKDYLILTTSALQVKLSKQTGEVSFYDKSGNLITSERNDKKPVFYPVEYDNEKEFKLYRAFASANDEAFYGLGQHQTGLMNYKGYQVDLTQYNGIAVVPFMVSSKNYGILWDNYSITKFGDVREYQQLSELNLYDKDKNPGSLTAIYNSADSKVIRKERQIDYEFLEDQKKFPEGYTLNYKSIVNWEGFIEAHEEGEHNFSILSSGYIKLWIDGELLLDKWREAWNPGPSVIKYSLQKGKMHAFRIEWRPDGEQAFLAVKFLTPQDEYTRNTYAFLSEAGNATNYYFIYGDDMDEIISGYRRLTGKAQVMPKWVMGFWQSRERYKTQEELLGALREFRKRRIPIDNIVLDWSYWKEEEWGSHDFDESRFPDPEAMVKEVQEKLNAKIMISVWPKFYEGISNYHKFDELGLLYKENILNKQRDWKGYVSTFYDAFHPKARDTFWKLLHDKLYTKGVDAWWLDATEPDILSNASIAHRKQLMNPTYLGSSTKVFNAYSLVNAKGIYEGQRQVNNDKRVFILTRSAFAGLQRYGAATWSGDISSTFKEMATQIPAGLNFCMSGLPYWTTDIGGFFVEDKYDRPEPRGEALEEWRELNARWYQYGTFTPLFRAHGQYPYREVFNIAPEEHPAYQSILYYNKLRYRLMPYIYSLTGMVYHDDYTIMRALVMDFSGDKNVLNIGDQFMFGPGLLINPVTEYKATSRELYLPEGHDWYDLYDGTFRQGGQHITANAPYERMPIYVKAGSIIPFGPDIQYTSEKPADPITLYIYGGKDASFKLYEDENENYNYEKGRYAIIPMKYDDAAKTLHIGDRQGEFDEMLKDRTFRIVFITPDKPKDLNLESKPDFEITFSGGAQIVNLM